MADHDESSDRHRLVLDRLQTGIVVHGADTQIRYANSHAAALLGWNPHSLLGVANIDSRWKFFGEDGSALAVDQYPATRALEYGETVVNLVVGLRKPSDDQFIWLICDAQPVHDATGHIVEAVVSFTDITRLKHVERNLHDSEERLRLVLEGSSDAPWDFDLLSEEWHYSPRWWEMLGRSTDAPSTADIWINFLHPEDKVRALEMYELARDTAMSFELEFRLLHAYGHYVPILARGIVLRDGKGKAIRIAGTNTDLTERKRAEAQAYRLAFFDQLTALPNRQLLIEQLHKALLGSSRSKRHGAIILLDIDTFKIFNDTLGHEIGDRLLQSIAKRIRSCVREADTVGRLGADEFVVILEHLHENAAEAAIEAERMAEQILHSLAEPHELSNTRQRATVSIAISLFDGSNSSVESALRQVDLAMYEAKARGRGGLRFFDSKMQISVDRRLQIESDLIEGLHLGQMRLYYQSQVSIGGRVLGAEVLLRWEHPENGLVMPDVFIPVAEASGVIVALGMWVLRAACDQLVIWSEHSVFSRLSLSVNVSVRQFNEDDFVQNVVAVVSETGADPARLKLEITESLFATDIEAIIEKMKLLKEIGIGFSLDDFGTGYSSLFYLQRMPLDQLKIDRTFVEQILSNPHHSAIARIIITLADTLELSVVAEGVETEGQRKFLEDHGCDAYQGYLFGPPVPLSAWQNATLASNTLLT